MKTTFVGPAVAAVFIAIAMLKGIEGPVAVTLVVAGYLAGMSKQLINAAIEGYTRSRNKR